MPACATTSNRSTRAAAIVPAMPEREDLPPEAREALTARMMRHGDELGALSLAVVLLDYEVVRALASRMVDEPVISRPLPGDGESVNALLPKSFFIHQDALGNATRRLVQAASHTDDAELAAAYEAVATSCLSCHSAYLHEELTTELGLPCELDDKCDEEDEPESYGSDTER